MYALKEYIIRIQYQEYTKCIRYIYKKICSWFLLQQSLYFLSQDVCIEYVKPLTCNWVDSTNYTCNWAKKAQLHGQKSPITRVIGTVHPITCNWYPIAYSDVYTYVSHTLIHINIRIIYYLLITPKFLFSLVFLIRYVYRMYIIRMRILKQYYYTNRIRNPYVLEVYVTYIFYLAYTFQVLNTYLYNLRM
jgi:hypothetical protein